MLLHLNLGMLMVGGVCDELQAVMSFKLITQKEDGS